MSESPESSEMRRICIYCGSRLGARPSYALDAQRLATAMVARNTGLVYGGASVGLMGLIADTVLAAGGSAIGVIPELLVAREIAHGGLTELHVVDTLHERKALMASLAHAFVAVAGGLGTLEELFETITWGMLGIHRKPIGLLNTEGYYDGLIDFLAYSVREGFISADAAALLRVKNDPEELLEELFPRTSAQA